jgi:hypothetical protein
VGPVNSSLSHPSRAVWNSTKPGRFFFFFSYLFFVQINMHVIFLPLLRDYIYIVVLHCTQKSKGMIRKYQNLTCVNQDFELT